MVNIPITTMGTGHGEIGSTTPTINATTEAPLETQCPLCGESAIAIYNSTALLCHMMSLTS